ncbi:hypothetical protein EUTSA_v10023723mg [Eutrema salsugineum]|uniref:NAC domain-containing protein n=1 Tax=Eutrema salsugineum TaxID=72664 RepID=V4MDY9_EUTSA|nr:protein CUP-SHAPED COTYLEDON 1 [Eutrema salsugineum]ESQ29461.1 hypothetical protein EUTSA_v10023723mg [Eutrema salsugineum]
MTMIYPPEDQIVAYYLKMITDKGNDWSSNFLESKDVYCVNPWTHFNTREPLVLHDGRYLFVNRTENSGKTDGCESGCWRIMGRDKLIKSEKNGEILGFKKVFKFCEKEEPKSIFRCWEKEKRRVRDKRIWVMQEYMLASKWKRDYVICKIRLLNPHPLEFMLSNHIRGYYI